MRLLNRFVCLVLFACMAFAAVCAEEIAPFAKIEEMRIEGAQESYVACPVFTVGQDAEISARINEMIQNQACIMPYVQLLSQITEGSTGLQMGYEMSPSDANVSIVSIVFSARGKMLTGRPSQIYYPMVMDLVSGEQVKLEQVVTNVDDFAAFVEMFVEDHAESILSTHMENSELFPVPLDNYALDETGITFYYDAEQLSFLSGFAGSITIPYHEMAAYLNLSENSVLDRLGYAELMLACHEDTEEKVRLASESGVLGALPVQIGMTLEDAFDSFRSTVDAGFYPAGAYYEMEDARLRGSLLLTDAQEENVTGIYSRNISLWGIRTGCTTREEWMQVLGTPDFSMEMGDSEAGQYLLCAGVSDYYDYGEYQLQLHADVDGVLYAAVLTNQ
ncbi:MAG: hypothetical protein IKT57_09080 [Clostridia bacterium]|nr:hypothetical protein [Clostridia bacterium]